MDTSLSKSDAKQQATEAKHELKPWIRRYGRIGNMAKGTVFVLIGLLSFMAAAGIGGQTTGTSGMFRSLASIPLGEVVIWLIGIGLIGYIVWIMIKIVKDPDQHGSDWKGKIIRASYTVSGLLYGGIAFQAIKIAMHAGSSGGGSQQTITAKVLSQPFGQWIIAIIGAGIIVTGISQLISVITGKFMNRFKKSEMNEHERHLAKNAGIIGLISRGIVFGLIGFFLIQTAINSNPEQTKGLDGALSELAQKPFGQWLLGGVAIGLILYGIFEIIRGRYEYMSLGK
ncbi:DUF1206 domain-containing protein [Sediminibacillus massiliensis]|uniref:DUF1206 domain-containing protein n=1 Tax=Sediminibacillus massiliensis TaxID=1926277 RepID=UPI00098846E2|nr:DUF1206 domain-containing protein [Sediminibacillus massiliensis]